MNELTLTRTLTAAGCNAQMELPLQNLVRDIIDAATAHANLLGVGYDRLIAEGNAWVLSRLAIEMKRYPRVGEEYALTTWIEDFNRHFSARNFEITGAGGEVIGYARSIWIAINIASRRPADLTSIIDLAQSISGRRCPMEPQGKLRFDSGRESCSDYTVTVSDIDSNRHLTTARYVELAVNCADLELYDTSYPARFETAFTKECLYGEALRVCSYFDDEDDCGGRTLNVRIQGGEGADSCACRIRFDKRAS